MSNWTEYKEGDVKIKHHSTPSLIELTITTNEEFEQGKLEEIKETVWFDYGTFADLRKVINLTTFP